MSNDLINQLRDYLDWDPSESHESDQGTPLATLQPLSQRRGALVGTAVVALVLLSGLIPVLLLNSDPPASSSVAVPSTTVAVPSTTEAPTTTTEGWTEPGLPLPRPPEPGAFRAPIRLEGSKQVVDLVFTDGSQVSLEWPEDVDIMSYGIRPYAWGFLPSVAARDFFIFHGDVESAVAGFGDPTLLSEYDDGLGGVVGLWRPAGWGVDFLGFQFGDWAVLVYEYSSHGPGEGPMGDAARAEWARSLRGETNQDGYLLLTAMEPLLLTPAGGSPSPMEMTLYSPLGFIEIRPEVCDVEYSSPPNGGAYSTWCDVSEQLSISVTGATELQEAVYNLVGVRSVSINWPED